MGKKTVTVCDRCGREQIKTKTQEDFVETTIPCREGYTIHDFLHVLLCPECNREFRNLVVHHFMDWDFCAGKSVINDAPYAEIAGLETLVEDQTKEIEELEEELERLRDVKDSLFEANFVLTAKLRELGVEVND